MSEVVIQQTAVTLDVTEERKTVIVQSSPYIIEVAKTGPQGPAGQLGANLYGIESGPLADRPATPDSGQAYVTTDTREVYIAVEEI